MPHPNVELKPGEEPTPERLAERLSKIQENEDKLRTLLPIQQKDIAKEAVTSAQIKDGTIAAADIANEAVGEAQLAASAVTSAKIKNGTIAAADLATEAKNLFLQLVAGEGFKLVWGRVSEAGVVENGKGITEVEHPETGKYVVKYAELANEPVVLFGPTGSARFLYEEGATKTQTTVRCQNFSGEAKNRSFNIGIIG